MHIPVGRQHPWKWVIASLQVRQEIGGDGDVVTAVAEAHTVQQRQRGRSHELSRHDHHATGEWPNTLGRT